jgi:CBS domain-containing protein
MRCEQVMSRDVQWIQPGATVARAAKLMAFHNLGLLPVCDPDGRPLGVVTDRDLAVRVLGEERPAARTSVSDVMTTRVQFVPRSCPIARVGELMTQAGISRLLVVEDDGRLAGIVSVADLLLHAPERVALETVRGVYARELPDRSAGRPHRALLPTPEYFHGAHDQTPSEGLPVEEPARVEADNVIRGGTSGFKEFPG